MSRSSRKTASLLALMLATIVHLSSAFVINSKRIVSSHGRVVKDVMLPKVVATSLSKLSATIEGVQLDAAAATVADDDVANVVLESLEKRLNGQSLTGAETSAALSASETLLKHLQSIQLRTAVEKLDTDTVSTLIEAGAEMDEATTERAFWTVVNAVDDAEANDLPLSSDMSNMLHHIFDADLKHLLTREKITTNVTCMKPDESGGLDSMGKRMNYVFDDGDHKNLPLAEGRKCESGNCCDKCSRNIFPTFAGDLETRLETFPELASLTFNDLAKVSSATIIQFVRLVERVRRTMAYEYGLDLSTLLPLQAYSRKYVAGTTQKGGGGGEGDFVTLHTDEATHEGYHYSCVLYLSTQGEDFEGGNFVFNDPAKTPEAGSSSSGSEEDDDDDVDIYNDELMEAFQKGDLPDNPLILIPPPDEDGASAASLEEEIRRAGRDLTPFHPTRGSAVIFSSGWENMHEVEKITAGVRYAVPCFFTTCPVPDIAYDQMKVGKPKTDEDIADDWLHLLLAHREEEPMESVGRVKELLMKWHYMCTPLSKH